MYSSHKSSAPCRLFVQSIRLTTSLTLLHYSGCGVSDMYQSYLQTGGKTLHHMRIEKEKERKEKEAEVIAEPTARLAVAVEALRVHS